MTPHDVSTTSYDTNEGTTVEQETMLGLDDYARRVGKSRRTVERWLERDELPGVVREVGGRWLIPAGAQRTTGALVGATSYDVVPAATPTASPLGTLGTLEEAATVLGTTVGGVRRLAADGHLIVGRYGPRGSLRVYLPA